MESDESLSAIPNINWFCLREAKSIPRGPRKGGAPRMTYLVETRAPFSLGGIRTESLILAQDERWRRA